MSKHRMKKRNESSISGSEPKRDEGAAVTGDAARGPKEDASAKPGGLEGSGQSTAVSRETAGEGTSEGAQGDRGGAAEWMRSRGATENDVSAENGQPVAGAGDSRQGPTQDEMTDVEEQEIPPPLAAPTQLENDTEEYWEEEEEEETAPEEPPPHLRLLVWLGTALLLVAVVVGAFWIFRRAPSGDDRQAGSEQGDERAASASTPTHFQPLVGRWVRADGGHVLEIRSVGTDGQMDANYYDPDTVFVSKAEASREGSDLKVFVELRDMDYPGCTYTLTYNRQGDRLDGMYFQAMIHGFLDARFNRERK